MTTKDANPGFGWDTPIEQPEGVTVAERSLKKLCDRSFLSLWSHAGIYRDQGKVANGHGKEVCDLLVVFENHIIIFSDKDCKYPNTGNARLDWSRWYRRSVERSADQVYGAERWIKMYPDHLFLDRTCIHRFPIELPSADSLKFHRIVVAHDAAVRCRSELGRSGSLMIIPAIIGKMHYDDNAEFPPSLPFGVTPFAIGQIDPARGYVHVLDDVSLDIVMQNRDTITDFVDYLSAKEEFIESGRLAWAAGEEDLLAWYMMNWDRWARHSFVLPPECGDTRKLAIKQGQWEIFGNVCPNGKHR